VLVQASVSQSNSKCTVTANNGECTRYVDGSCCVCLTYQ
jgi:hypothetical protein